MQDMLGKEFDIEKDEKGREIWRSKEHPEFTFIPISEKDANEDGVCILEPHYFSSSACYYEDAVDKIFGSASRGNSSSLTGDPAELLDIMPVMKQMFVPLINNEVIAATSSKGCSSKVFVCNATPNKTDNGAIKVATYNTGRGALTKYLGKAAYGIAPGCLMVKEGKDPVSILDRTLEKNLATADTPLKKVNTILEALHQEPFLGDRYNDYAIFYEGNKSYKIMKMFSDNAVLLLEDRKEDSQKLFDDFVFVKDRLHLPYTESASKFYDALARYAPDVFLQNVSQIEKDGKVDVFNLCGDIYLRGKPQALDFILANADYKKTPKIKSSVEDVLYDLMNRMQNRPITDPDKAKIIEKLTSKEHIDDIFRDDIFSDAFVTFCNNFTKKQKQLPPQFCEGVMYFLKKVEWYSGAMQPTLERMAMEDLSYLHQNLNLFYDDTVQRIALKNHSVIPTLKYISSENFDAFAEIYEQYAAKLHEDRDNELQKLKNTQLGNNEQAKEIMHNIKEQLLDMNDYGEVAKSTQMWLVKNAKKFPNLVNSCTESGKLPYVKMCLDNLENPQKENIGSLLNRLETKEAKDFQDFQEALDFVHRRDMCKKACVAFNKAASKEKGIDNFIAVDAGQLSYSMAEANIKDPQTAQKVVDLFSKMNERPATHQSEYNTFYPDSLVNMVNLEDWMLPVIKQAAYEGTINPSRLGSDVNLFAACKAWKINPRMPRAVAEQVGEMPLAKRMIAGSIIAKMVKQEIQKAEEEEKISGYLHRFNTKYLSFVASNRLGVNDNKKLIPEFWQEMAKAQEMSFTEAMKTYIPDTTINRKRLVAAVLEEMGIENSSQKYKSAYKKMEQEGAFEKFLKPRDAQNDSRAKIEQHREEVREVSAARKRLAEKGIIPETGKHGEGHQIKIPAKDMSDFKSFVR